MNDRKLFYFIFFYVCVLKCEGITNYENEQNLIGEEERRGVIIKENTINDPKHSEPTKRGLWLIGSHQQSSDYETGDIGSGYHGASGPGGYGYVDSGAYGVTGTGYNIGASEGGYHKGHTFGPAYGYSGGGLNFGHGGINFGHNGYEDPGHGVSHNNYGFNKLALKKLLIPLAGLAILGAAAALSSNPVLLQLGTVNSGRKRRSIYSETSSSSVYPTNPWIRPE